MKNSFLLLDIARSVEVLYGQSLLLNIKRFKACRVC